MGGLNDISASRRPRDGEWSVKEVVCHLRDANDVFHGRIQRMLTEDAPYLKSVNMESVAAEKHYIVEDWREAWAGLLAAHERNMAAFTALTQVQWQRPATHQELGVITIERIPTLLRDHLQTHITQVRQIKEQNAARDKRQSESRRYDYGNDDEYDADRGDRYRAR